MKKTSHNSISWYLTGGLVIISYLTDFFLLNQINSYVFKNQSENKMLSALITAITIPLVARIALWIFESYIWPFTESQGGWYMYAFKRHANGKVENIVGRFKLIHRINESVINETQVYKIGDLNEFRTAFEEEAIWKSDLIKVENGCIELIFKKIEDNSPKGKLIYTGYMKLKKIQRDTLPENFKPVYDGYIEDVDRRTDIHGAVFATKLPKKIISNSMADEQLRNYAIQMIQKCY